MDNAKCGQATPHFTLLEQLLDPNIAKTEREWADAREIESMRDDLKRDKPLKMALEALTAARTQNDRLRTINADLLAALKALTATSRTFRNVPKDEQEWTSLDDEALDNAFAVLARARGTA